METNKELPTINEYLDEYFTRLVGYDLHKALSHNIQNPTYISGYIAIASHEYAVLFAKHHREKAIEAMKDLDVIQDLYGEIGNSKIREIEEGIENAYKESEIK